jgi:hypothetical protein
MPQLSSPKVDSNSHLSPRWSKKRLWGAVAGLFVLVGLFFVVANKLANMREARKYNNEFSARLTLRDLKNAQAIYIEKSTVESYGTLKQLIAAGLANSDLSSGRHNGYHFAIHVDKKQPQYEFSMTAEPIENSVTGDRYFFTSQSGVLRFNVGDLADESSVAT